VLNRHCRVVSHVKMDPYNDRLFMQISRKIKTIGAGLAIAAAASLFGLFRIESVVSV